MTFTDRLAEELRRLFGHGDFRSGQREIIEAVMAGEDVLAVLPTGGGKSLTYQLPAMLADGVTLVLSPLIALMKDQAQNLPEAVGARTTIINSSLEPGEVWRRLRDLAAGRTRLVYAAPERLRQPAFLYALQSAGIELVVVDEAHCISQWGHDFRPDYRAVGRAVATLQPRAVLAVTATATRAVQDDIERQLGRSMRRIVRPTFRDNLTLRCVHVADEEGKKQRVLELCRQATGPTLIYARSREKCEMLAMMLRRHGLPGGYYHAGLPPEERAAAQDRFMTGACTMMAATVAFGMGVDKPDIRQLIHYNPSGSLENYYQEAGRAGRDGAPSECTLLFSRADTQHAMHVLRDDGVTLDDLKNVYGAVRGRVGRLGPIAADEVAGLLGPEGEERVRSAVPLLEQCGLLLRHVDLPQSITVTLRRTTNGDAATMLARLSEIDGQSVPAMELSRLTGVSPIDLEMALLGLQEEGMLSFRTSGREMLFEILKAPAGAKDNLARILSERERQAASRTYAMLGYARDPVCRHGAIARYFGDQWDGRPCGACDHCLAESSEEQADAASTPRTQRSVDASDAALNALSVIRELSAGNRPYGVGRTGLAKILRGAPDAPVAPGRVAGFGALSHVPKADVERLVDAVVDRGYLFRDDADPYRCLKITREGVDALDASRAEIYWKPARAATYDTPVPSKSAEKKASRAAREAVVEELSQGQRRLLDALKTWRTQQATTKAVPPYVVFSDKTLIEIVLARPSTTDDLLSISGIGPKKADEFGADVLRIVLDEQ